MNEMVEYRAFKSRLDSDKYYPPGRVILFCVRVDICGCCSLSKKSLSEFYSIG